MTAIWGKLILLLNQTLKIYQDLLQLSRKKREILIAANPQALEQVTKQEEMLIIEAGKLEKLRLPVTRELADALNMPPDQVAISALSEQADSETANQLRSLSKEFTEVSAELVKLNELNEKLIKQSLDYISYNINILSQSKAEPIYAPKGQTGMAGSGCSILDAKV